MDPLPIPEDDEGLVEWALKNPGIVRRALRQHNAIVAFETRLVSKPSDVGNAIKLVAEEEKILLPLPLKFRRELEDVAAYSDTAGGAYSQGDTQAIMDKLSALVDSHNALLEELRQTGQNR